MKGFPVLGVGVATLAFVLGYMVAASGTPVGAVTVPALFGIVVTVFGLVQSPWINKDVVELIKTANTDGQHKPIIDSLGRHLNTAPARVGGILICFSIGFMGGAVVGAKARISSWFASPPARFEAIWKKHRLNEPPTADAALYWIYVQGVLEKRGLDDEAMKGIYVLQSRDWNARASLARNPAAPSSQGKPDTPRPTDTKTSGDDTLQKLNEWNKELRTNGGNANPIADQPPPGSGKQGGA